jgi:hypothetical protein
MRAIHGLCEAEVAELDVQVHVQHYIQALQVAMHHNRVLRVEVHHTVCQLQAHVDAVQQGQAQPSDMEKVVQRASWHVLSHETKIWDL